MAEESPRAKVLSAFDSVSDYECPSSTKMPQGRRGPYQCKDSTPLLQCSQQPAPIPQHLFNFQPGSRWQNSYDWAEAQPRCFFTSCDRTCHEIAGLGHEHGYTSHPAYGEKRKRGSIRTQHDPVPIPTSIYHISPREMTPVELCQQQPLHRRRYAPPCTTPVTPWVHIGPEFASQHADHFALLTSGFQPSASPSPLHTDYSDYLEWQHTREVFLGPSTQQHGLHEVVDKGEHSDAIRNHDTTPEHRSRQSLLTKDARPSVARAVESHHSLESEQMPIGFAANANHKVTPYEVGALCSPTPPASETHRDDLPSEYEASEISLSGQSTSPELEYGSGRQYYNLTNTGGSQSDNMWSFKEDCEIFFAHCMPTDIGRASITEDSPETAPISGEFPHFFQPTSIQPLPDLQEENHIQQPECYYPPLPELKWDTAEGYLSFVPQTTSYCMPAEDPLQTQDNATVDETYYSTLESDRQKTDSSGPRDTSQDHLLLKLRGEGHSYKEIKRLGHFREAESTLRGRFRALTKTKEERPRKPEWRERDVRHLLEAVKYFTNCHHSTERPGLHNPAHAHQNVNRIPWKQVAERMARNGTHRFGNATVKKKWLEVTGRFAGRK